MLAWSDEQTMFRDAVRRFVEAEVAPHRLALESGELLPYGILRAFYEAFGIGDAECDRFEARVSARRATAEGALAVSEVTRVSAAERLIPVIEFARHSPGMVTAMGVSAGLTAGAILRGGDERQQRRWALDLLSFRKIGAWAITEADSGSDAFGSMRSTAKRVGDEFVLNGSKTFITNGPFADTIVFICKLDDGSDTRNRAVLSFVLDQGMDGLEQGAPLRKMGLHSSPTGELSLHDVRVGQDRLLSTRSPAPDQTKSQSRSSFASERASAAAMALGIIERCLSLSVEYAKNRKQFGVPIGDFQLVQLKLAKMEVARLNVENLVFRHVEMLDNGVRPTLAEASAMKLYAAEAAMAVSLEAVQVFGGSGYMSDNPVEQLCRDAKVLQIYAGTDEIQVTHIARDLLRR